MLAIDHGCKRGPYDLVVLFPVCAIVPFSDAWEGHPAHVAEEHALVAHAVAKDAVHLPPGEDRGRVKLIRGWDWGRGSPSVGFAGRLSDARFRCASPTGETTSAHSRPS